ncbi:MFS transporter [Legionella sp. W05-934-2]|jgi:sugar phosphate permease|uniref:MFS transporter n=1 Tax=Legionella sp. W05-934-2 TaxID=1198649 RepID=UPI003461E9EA
MNRNQDDTLAKPSKTHFRWFIISLLFIITGVNYLDRSSIAYAIDEIAAEFHFTNDQIGFILGAFGVGYVVTTFLGGIAVDKIGAKRVLTLSMLLWGVTSLITSLANGFFLVFIARVLLGFAEGPGFPVLSRAISDWLPETERNRALAYALIAVPLSLAIGGPISSFMVTNLTWRGTYVALAILAVIWIPLWLRWFQDSPAHSPFVNEPELAYIERNPLIASKITPTENPWRVIILNRTLLINNWAFFVFGYYLFFFMTWLPTYLSNVYKLDLTQIGLYSVAPWLAGAILMWGMGYLSDALFKRYHSLRLSRSLPISITQLLSASCIIPIILVHNIDMAMIFITLAVGLILSANASYFAVVIDLAKERTGTAIGIMDAIFAISGIAAPTLTGVFLTLTGRYEAGFILLAFLGLSSSLLVFFFHNRET